MARAFYEVSAPRFGILHRCGCIGIVAEGKIKLKSGVTMERINEEGVVLDDGTELPADLIVYATGYGSMNGLVAKLISQEIAERVGKCWGLGSGHPKDPGPWEGELRNMWKPTRQPSLVVSRWQSTSIAPLLSMPILADQGADGRDSDSCVWHGRSTSRYIVDRRTGRISMLKLSRGWVGSEPGCTDSIAWRDLHLS